jgi:hypothetical protein
MSLEPVDAKSRYITLVLGDAGRRGFDRVLLDTGASRTQFVPVHHRQDPGPAGPGPGAAPASVVFGAHEAEGGVKVYYIDENGPWPFQYYRRAEFGYDTNDEVHAQLAATPWLDPKAFGTRPGAAPGADYALQPGQKIIVLDQKRLDYLEQQRALLGKIDRTPGNRVGVETRDDQVTQLGDLIYSEIDYATVGQAVPDFNAVIENIRVRAPDDPLFQRAISQAEARLKAEWQADGRTPDQLGVVLAAAERGDYAAVSSLTRDQFVARIDALGPDAAPPLVQAEILRLSGIYSTYVAGNPEKYQTAVLDGAEDAATELLVNRPVKTVLDIARAGGDDWANKAITKLRELVMRADYTPEQVLAIMSNPDIQRLIRQGLRHAESLDAPEQGKLAGFATDADGNLVKDVSAIYSMVLYADGKPGTGTGKGKQLVDDMAQFIVDNTSIKGGSYTLGSNYNYAFRSSASEGHIALALAVGAKARGVEYSAFENDPVEFHVRQGIVDFGNKVKSLQEQIGKESGFLQVPLASMGGQKLTPEQRMEIIDGLMAAFPKETKALNSSLHQLNAMVEGPERMQIALDTYRGVYKDSEAFKVIGLELDKVPKPDPVVAGTGQFPGEPAGIASTNTLWFARAHRFTADYVLRNFTPLGDKGAFQRTSRGVSSFLFLSNARALLGGPVEDMLFVPVHSMMAATHGAQAVFGESWSKTFYGPTPNGDPDTRFTLTADALEARVNGLNVDARTKKLLITLGKGAIRDPLDIAYIGVDGYNALANYKGWTESGEQDLVRTVAYGISVLSDASLIVGTGLTAVGGGATLLGMGAAGWTGVGAVLMLIASGTNYFKGLHDHAHEFDAYNAKGWELLGIRDPEVAKYLGMGATMADGDSYKNAGPFLVAMFAHAGYTPEEMVTHINANWTPEQADKLATYIKRAVTRRDDGSFTEEDFASIESYAENVGIKVPDYYNESNSPFKPDPNAPPAWEWVGP